MIGLKFKINNPSSKLIYWIINSKYIRTSFKTKISILVRSLRIIPVRDRKKLIYVSLTQVCLGILDLVGVALFGILGALAVNGIQSKQPGNRVSDILAILSLEKYSFQYQVAALAIFSTAIFMIRTIASIFFSRKIIFFLSKKASDISSNMVEKLFSQSLTQVRFNSGQEVLFSVTTGVSNIALGIIANLILLINDFSLLIIIGIGLIVVDINIAITTFIFFGLISHILYKSMSQKSRLLGRSNSSITIESNQKILEALDSFRELFVKHRTQYYISEISKSREKLSSVLANIQFLPNISKYVIESSLIFGSVLIGALQFLLNDATHAIATLTVFLAAGTRIAPAILRIQQSLLQIQNNLGSSETTLDLFEKLQGVQVIKTYIPDFVNDHNNFIGNINLTNVSYKYSEKSDLAINNLSLDVKAGEFVAIVGPSGAGKTTLADLILGVLEPIAGEIIISGNNPRETIKIWPGAISYVPQDVLIINGTIKQNICFGFPDQEIPDSNIWEALETSGLERFVRSLPNDIHTQVGDRGNKLSGGQRQKIGIARSLITKPKLLVLDEATSSLDGEAESLISDAIKELKGNTTVLLIAHRLSTVRNADLVVYIENGTLLASGKFDELRKIIPNFEKQASLMGL